MRHHAFFVSVFVAAVLLLSGSTKLATAAPLDVGVVPSLISVSLRSGQKETINVTVYNREGTSTSAYRAYLLPMIVTPQGGFDFESEGIPPSPLQQFVTITPEQFDIPAGQSTRIQLRIDVPIDAEPSANQLLLFVENITALRSDEPGIRTVGRIGVPLFGLINLSDASVKNLTPQITEKWIHLRYAFKPLLSKKDGRWTWDWTAYGRPEVTSTIVIRNDGSAYAMVAGPVTFSPSGFWGSFFGGSHDEHPLTPKYVAARGGVREFVDTWTTSTWFGRMQVHANLSVQDGESIVLQRTIFIVPWLHIITLLIFVAAGVTVRLIVRSRRKKSQSKTRRADHEERLSDEE